MITRILPVFTLIAIAFPPAEVLAQPLRQPASFVCRSAQQIDRATMSCEDNEAYAESAVLCLRQLQKLVRDKTGGLQENMSRSNDAHVSEAVRSQTNAMGGAASNYNLTTETLNELLQAAQKAREYVESYIENIYVPDEIAYVEAGMNLDEILLDTPCYKDNHEVLIWVEDDVNKIIDELQAARSKAASLENHSGSRKVSQDSSLVPAVRATGQQGEAAPTGPKGKGWGNSDISGTEKIKKP